MQEHGLDDELFKTKLAYPNESFMQSAFGNLGNFDKPLNLTKEDFWSTLKQETPQDEEINHTQVIIRKFKIQNVLTQELTRITSKWLSFN